MLRFTCPTCHSLVEVPADRAGSRSRCPFCSQGMVVPSPPPVAAKPERALVGPSTAPPNRVVYLHHTRDMGGDIIFYFTARPVAAAKRCSSRPL